MNAEQLRAIQAPLKDTYRNNAQAAWVTLQTSGQMGEGITCKVATGKALWKLVFTSLRAVTALPPVPVICSWNMSHPEVKE
jgi:hypothetical protein